METQNIIIITYSDKYFPKLNDKGKNPAQIWVIKYYLYNANTGKYDRQRKSISPTEKNKGNYTKRLAEAKSIMADLKRKMNNGLFIKEVEKNNAPILPPERTLEEAIKEYIDFQADHEEMVKAIKAVVSIMQRVDKSMLVKPLTKVDKQDCLYFKNEIKKLVSASTCNYYMRVFRCFLNYAVEHEWIAQNPSKGIKTLKTQDSSSNFPFTATQRQAILDKALGMGEKQLYLLCQFMYYTLARPYEEIQLLKVSDIGEKEVFYMGNNTKSGQSCAVEIAPSLEAIIQEYKLREYPAEYYIFGKTGEPDKTPQGRVFYAKHRKILKSLNLTNLDDKRYTFYSHKPTGAIALAKRAKSYSDLRKIQKMCRHKSLEETENYLRKMGVNISSDENNFLE